MAKVTFKFLEASVNDGEVRHFIEKLEKVLKSFAGEAYHFRFDVEDISSGDSSNPQGNGLETRHGGRHRF